MISWLNEDDPAKINRLYQRADTIRHKTVGDDVYLRGVVEFSNYCAKNCLYCGLRRSNRRLKRYRLTAEQIFNAAKTAKDLGYGTVVLQSGEESGHDQAAFCRLITRIRHQLGLVVTLGLGEKTYRQLKAFRDAGADRYLLKFETSDKSLYRRLRPDSRYADRFRCLAALKRLRFQTGSGNMVGLPGQSLKSLAEDIALFKKLDLDMIGIGPFISHKHTPLARAKNGGLEMVLKTVALTRINAPYANIPATTAVGTIDSLGRQRALASGANIVMPNVTPVKYRKYYQIYPDKICINDKALTCAGCLDRMITGLGRKIGTGPGHSIKTR